MKKNLKKKKKKNALENAATYSQGGIELGTSDEKAHGACYGNTSFGSSN